MKLRLLGEPTVSFESGEVREIGSEGHSDKTLSLIGLVAYGKRASVTDLNLAMWPGDHDTEKRRYLENYASKARSVLGVSDWRPSPIRKIGGAYKLDLDDGGAEPGWPESIEIDIGGFRASIEQAEQEDHPESDRTALDLVCGPYMQGMDAGAYPWLQDLRETIFNQCVRACERITTRPSDECKEAIGRYFRSPDGTLLEYIDRQWPDRDAFGGEPSAAPSSSSQSPVQIPASPDRSNDQSLNEPVLLAEPSTPAEPVARSIGVIRRPLAWLGLGLILVTIIFVIGTSTGIVAIWDDGKESDGKTTASDEPPIPGMAPVSDDPPTGDPVTPADELNTESGLKLAAGLKVANRSYDNEWKSTKVRADPTDRLRFALTVSNPHEVKLAGMTAYVVDEQTYDEESLDPRRIRVVVGDDLGRPIARSGWTTVLPWSNQGTEFSFDFDGVEVADADKPDEIIAVRHHKNGTRIPWELQHSPDIPSSATLGPVSKDEQVFYLNGTLGLQAVTGLGGYPPKFRRLEPEPSDWMNTGSVQPGDLIEIGILLDNQGNHTGNTSVILRPQRRQKGRVARLVAMARMFDKRSYIGALIMNSQTGQPISVLPRSGTTVLEAPDPEKVSGCDPERPKRILEDGIMFGGVDIGPFGGFTAQADCAGVEYNGMLYLKAVITD